MREVEPLKFLGRRQLCDGHLVFDRTRPLVRNLRLQQLVQDPLGRMLATGSLGENLVVGGSHPLHAECGHQFEDGCPSHRGGSRSAS